MFLLIELLTRNLVLKIYKNRPTTGIRSNEKLYNVKCAITDIHNVYVYFYWLETRLIKTLSPP